MDPLLLSDGENATDLNLEGENFRKFLKDHSLLRGGRNAAGLTSEGLKASISSHIENKGRPG